MQRGSIRLLNGLDSLMETWIGKVTVDNFVLAERMSYMFSKWLITTLLNDGHLHAGILLISGPNFKIAEKYLKYCSGN